MKIQKSILLACTLLASASLSLNGCSKDEDSDKLPQLSTNALREITLNSATAGGSLTLNEGSTITAYGSIWSIKQFSGELFANGQLPEEIEKQFPDEIFINKTTASLNAGSFNTSMFELTQNQLYFVRAFAINGAGAAYGNEIMFTTASTVTDIDGNVYTTLDIGSQKWMTENLRVSRYNNGDEIMHITDGAEWAYLGVTLEGAWAWHNNNAGYDSDFGKLYNWFAVNDDRNLCPSGWHVPTIVEWDQLRDHLDPNANGNVNIAGDKMKTTGTAFWKSPNTGATNEPGFNAVPGGHRSDNGEFYDFDQASWWSSSFSDAANAHNYNLYHDYADAYHYVSTKHFGLSIRCVKD